MIDTIIYIEEASLKDGIQEGSYEIQSRIADSWLKYFLHINV